MTLFGRERRSSSPFPEPPVPPWPGFSFAGGSPTADSAMRLDAVWACIRLLADSVSMMPVGTYTIRQGAKVPIAAPLLFTTPAVDTPMTDWLYQVMVSALTSGNAYGHIVATSGGYPSQIELLDPARVGVRQAPDGSLTYTVGGVKLNPGAIWHFRAFRRPGSTLGMSPIANAASVLSTQSAVQQFAQGFFTDGAHPSSILTTDQAVNQDQARTIKDRFIAAVNGREPTVLGSGVKYQSIQVSPEESQFLETQKFGLTQIARIFGVPPEMIGGSSGNSMNYANVTQRAMDYLTYSVQPWLSKLEASFYPLLPGQKHVRFDTSVLVRMSPTDRWDVNKTRLTTASATINEVRLEEDQPPVAWGDEPYLPGIAPAAAADTVLSAAPAPEDPTDSKGGAA